MKITDANGKEFNVEVEDFMHFTTDADIERGKGFSVADSDKGSIDFTPAIVDADGNKVDLTILDSQKNDKPIKAIDVTFEATHSGRNRNHFVYHSDSMEKDSQSWMNPFQKPFLKNHDMHSEPMGRVNNYSFSQSELNPDRDCINVTFRITDAEAIPKFLDGRYKTMSIGGNVKSITCGICGKSILKDNKVTFCGHWKGETYKDQVCLWNGRDIEYVEGSSVNAPADDWALVKKIVINPDSANSAKDADNNEANIDGKDNAMKAKVQVLDTIDDLTAVVSDDVPPVVNPVEEPITDNTPAETDPAPAPEVTIESLQDEINGLKADKTTLSESLVLRDTEITTLNTTVADLNEKISVLDETNKDLREKAVNLAVMNKNLMAERIVDFMLFNAEITDEEKEAKLNELLLKKAKELSDMNENLKIVPKAIQATSVPQASNPGLVNTNDGVTIIEQTIEDKKVDEPNDKASLKDLEESIINTLTRKNGYKKEEI